MNKIAICEWSLPIKGPSMLPVIKQLGLDGMQLDDWSSWEHGFPMSDPTVQRLYRTAAEQTGLEFPSMGCNGFSRLGGFVNRMGTEQGKRSVSALLRTKEICQDMGIPLAMFPCCWDGFLRTEEDLENAARMLREVCKYYDDSPVDIAVESVLSPKQYQQLFQYVGSKSLKIYYDTQNTQYFANADPAEELKQLDISDVAEVHFKDGLKTVQGCVTYGTGETGFQSTVEVLKQKGYSGWCVIENFYMKPTWRDRTYDVYGWIEEDVKRLRKAFG